MSGRRLAHQAPTMAHRSLSFVPPPLALWVALWVAPWAAVGQGLLGQRPRQAGSPLRPPGPPKSLLPISQSKWRLQTPASFLFFCPPNACLLLGQSTRSDPVFISQAPPWSVTSHRPSLPSPAHHSLSQFHSCQDSSDPGRPPTAWLQQAPHPSVLRDTLSLTMLPALPDGAVPSSAWLTHIPSLKSP